MEFKTIRNKIKKLTFDSTTKELLALLKEIESDNEIRYPFWHVLLILKWNLEFSTKNYKAKIANRNDILKLLKQVDKLEMSHEIFNPVDGDFNINKTMTILAHQQFLYQNNAFWDTFVRQLILFDELKHKYCIKSSFEKLTKVNLEKFIKISFIIYLTSFITEKSDSIKSKFIYRGYLSKEVTDLIIQLYGKQTFSDYFNLLSISKESINTFIANDKRSIRNYDIQPFEASIFTRKPFLVHNDQYTIPYKDVLKHNFNHFIYEFMKNNDDSFTTEFGIRMEKYVKLGLDEIKINYKTENEIRLILGKEKNSVDYLIDDNILVEIKAIELKPYASINPNNKILANEFRKNIVKGYAKQMINVARNLTSDKPYYGIIITYKKLFLGNSNDIWEQFLKEESLKICSTSDLELVPYQNLFFIDIESWDKLIQILKQNKVTLKDVLEKIKLTDSNPKTKKFNFSMHLEDDFNFQKYNLSYLTKPYERFKLEKRN